MNEHDIQNSIRIALSPFAVVFRANVGKGLTYDGRHFDTGLPKGFSDLFGFRKSDGKIFFIEVKSPFGKPSEHQKKFIESMKKQGAVAGICRSPEDALRLIGADENAQTRSADRN